MTDLQNEFISMAARAVEDSERALLDMLAGVAGGEVQR